MATKPTRSWFRAASRRRNCLVAALVLAVIPRARAQYIDLWQAQQETERSRWLPQLKYINTDVELEKDSFSSSVGSQQPLERLYVLPSFGLQWDGYIYHPYLLTYSALFEPGYLVRLEGPPNAILRSDELMLNGKFTANLLSIKPYATTLTYDHNYGEVKYDIFNTEIVDSQSYGMTTGYHDGPVPVTLSFQQTHEDSTGFNQTAITDETLLDLHARNERGQNTITDFSYEFGQFNRDLNAGGIDYPSDTSYQRASIFDNEQFDQSSLRSTFQLYDVDTAGSSSVNVNATENYNLNITPKLLNYDNYAFSYYSGDGARAMQHFVTVGVQHTLFESLVSGMEARGSVLNSQTDGNMLDLDTVGPTGTLDYTKKLGGWGTLIIGNTGSYTWNKQDATGSTSLVPNESHTIPLNGLIRLSQPRDLSIVSITDANGVPLIAGSDYNLIPTTDPWQIQILFTGPSHLQTGRVILVTYTIQTNPSGSYKTFGSQSQITLRFWKERADIFAHYDYTQNHTDSPDFILDNVREVQAGADLNWLNANLHADYTDHRSDYYSYYGWNLLENYSFVVDADSTISIDLAQQFLTYPPTTLSSYDQNQHLSFYSFMVRHEWHPNPHLSVNGELGYLVQRGFGFDEDLLAARAYLNWQMGKAEVHLGYEHDTQTLVGEKMLRDYVFMRLRRNF